MIIAVDVDDVCADLIGEWLRRYGRITAIEAQEAHILTPDDITSWNVTEQFMPEHREAGYNVLFHDDLYEGVDPMPGARDAVKKLRELGRVIFVTSCPNMAAAGHKWDWLKRHGFEPTMDSYFVAKDKSLIRADVLFDDGIHNVESFTPNTIRGCGVLVQRPHNRSVVWHGASVESLSYAPAFVKNLLVMQNLLEGRSP